MPALTVPLVALTVFILLMLVAFRPADFRIARSSTIHAPLNVVFAQVNDFHNWPAWSPWEQIDSQMQRTYEGPASGTGSIYSWSGNKHVGAGRMTIGESHPNSLIRIRLEFFRPFRANNVAEFDFRPNGDHTTVFWSMSGRKNFMTKLFTLFMSMDKMIGAEFEKGLAQLKNVAEAAARK